jgi:hypothetical protein
MGIAAPAEVKNPARESIKMSPRRNIVNASIRNEANVTDMNEQMKKENAEIDALFSSVQQDVIRFIRHCAQRNGVTQDYVRVSMQSVLDNQIINP